MPCFVTPINLRTTGTLHIFGGGGGGGSSLATITLSNAHCLCVPSQKGLFCDCPQRQRATWVRPPSPNTLPCESTISKSPSILMEPLSLIVIFVPAISSLSQTHSTTPEFLSTNSHFSTLAPRDPLRLTKPRCRPSSSISFGTPRWSGIAQRPPSACRCGSAPRFRASYRVR
jgi:hypothetical protein